MCTTLLFYFKVEKPDKALRLPRLYELLAKKCY